MEGFGLLLLWDIYDKAYTELQAIHESTPLESVPNNQTKISDPTTRVTIAGLILACLSILEGMAFSAAYAAANTAGVAHHAPLDETSSNYAGSQVEPSSSVRSTSDDITALVRPSSEKIGNTFQHEHLVAASDINVEQLSTSQLVSDVTIEPLSESNDSPQQEVTAAVLEVSGVLQKPEASADIDNTSFSSPASNQVSGKASLNNSGESRHPLVTSVRRDTTTDEPNSLPQTSLAIAAHSQLLPEEAIPQMRVLSPTSTLPNQASDLAIATVDVPSKLESLASTSTSIANDTALPEGAVPVTTVLSPQSAAQPLQTTNSSAEIFSPSDSLTSTSEAPRSANFRDSALNRVTGAAEIQTVAQPKLAEQPELLLAQAIIPADDGTGTEVTPLGNQIDIQGGALSGDGANLFHSFQQFGLSNEQIANFLTTPEIHNVLSRIIGGDPSNVDGLIRVTGSSANLYLMNPAGIVFGPNAQLDVPAGFTATTADGIGFDEDIWFSASGENLYSSLQGDPTTFAFTAEQPGALVNAGDLAVSEEQSLTLLGGTVTNTGTLTAPGGQIAIAAVPGQNQIRISQAGVLLELEIAPIAGNGPNPLPYSPATLPALLTGSEVQQVTGIRPNPDGTVELTGSGTLVPVTDGTGIVAGDLDVSGDIGGEVNILGDRIAVTNANINAAGDFGGGTVRIGGDYQGDDALPAATTTFIDNDVQISADALLEGDGGLVVGWAENTTGFYGDISARGGSASGDGGFVEVSGKQDLIYRGSVDTSAANGAPGTLLLDPENILIVNGDGGADDSQLNENIPGQILSGQGVGETFTISELALEQLSGDTNVLLEATNDITLSDLSDNELTFAAGEGNITLTADADNNGVGAFAMIDLGDLNVADDFGDQILASGRDVTISGASISLGRVATDGITDVSGEIFDSGSIRLDASNGNVTAHTLSTRFFTENTNAGRGGNITVTAPVGSIQARTITSDSTVRGEGNASDGGNILFNAGENIQVTQVDTRSDNFTESSVTTANATAGNGGAITLNSGGNIFADSLISSSSATATGDGAEATAGTGGQITVTASGNIEIASSSEINQSINSSSSATATDNVDGNILETAIANSGNGGQIALNSGGDINIIGDLNSSSSTIATDEFGGVATATSGDGGAITIENANSITVDEIDTSSSATSSSSGNPDNETETSGSGGAVTLAATNTIDITNDVQTEAQDGDGGVIIFSSGGAIIIGDDIISSSERANGGSISLTSGSSIAIGDDILAQAAETGNGGDIFLDAVGDITLNAEGGEGLGNIESDSESGNGGDITVISGGSITADDINAAAINESGNFVATSGNSGNIRLTSGSEISVRDLNAFSSASVNSIDSAAANAGNAGIVELSASGDISVDDINASSSASSAGGSVGSSASSGNGGSIVIDAGNEIIVDEIDVSSSASATDTVGGSLSSTSTGNAGSVVANSGNAIQAFNIDSSVSGGTGDGGDIALDAGTNIIIDAEITSATNQGTGGSISLLAGGLISIGEGEGGEGENFFGPITTSSKDGSGGTVELNAEDDILVRDGIDASGINGPGGQIEITTTTGDISAGVLNSSSSATATAESGVANATAGNGGAITLNSGGNIFADSLISTSSATATGDSVEATAGAGGQITVTASGDIDIDSSFEITQVVNSSSSAIATDNVGSEILQTATASAGNGGQITLNSGENIGIFGDLNASSSTSATDEFGGVATANSGNGGEITIESTNSISVDRVDSSSFADSESTNSSIDGTTATSSDGGNVNLNTTTGNISAISIDSSSSAEVAGNKVTASTGSGGNISSTAFGNINISENLNTSADADAFDDATSSPLGTTSSSAVNGGDITLNSNNGAITIGGLINSFSSADATDLSGGTVQANTGNGGNIDLDAGNNIVVNSSLFSGILFSGTENNGNGGNIRLNADGGSIQAFRISSDINEGTGNGGNIDLVASTDIIIDDDLDSDTNQGTGGRISLRAGGHISVGEAIAGPGDPFFGPITSNSGNGNGGAVELNAGGDILVRDGIDTSGINGLSGQVNLTSGNELIAGDIDATSTIWGSDISLTSNSLDLVGGTDSVRSNGGNLLIQSFTPSQNLQFDESIFSILEDGFNTITIGRSDGSGAITLTGNLNISDPLTVRAPSGSGSINSVNAALTTNGNNITFIANENITVGPINSNSNVPGSGGFISLRSDEIDLTGAISSSNAPLTLEPFSAEQNIAIGGTNNATSSLDLTRAELNQLQDGFSTITIGSEEGSGAISIEPFAFLDDAFLQTPNGRIAINGGLQPNVTLDAEQITTTLSQDINASTPLNFFGNIILADDISIATTGTGNDLTFQGPVEGSQTLNINAAGSNVNFENTVGQTDSLNQLTINSQTTTLRGNVTATGDVTFNSDIEAPLPIEIRSQTGAVNTENITANGNRVALLAQESITAGNIDTSSAFGQGGDVFLDPEGDIQVGFINAEGGPNSTGGSVDITTQRFFRATETFITQNDAVASISTTGGAGNGTIIIRHGGGPRGEPFIIGDASENGTAGAITTGNFSLEPIRVLPGTFDDNGIAIRTFREPELEVDEVEQLDRDLNEEPPPEIVLNRLASQIANDVVAAIEESYTNEFKDYLELPPEDTALIDVPASRETLSNLAEQTGVKPALIYVTFAPVGDNSASNTTDEDNEPVLSSKQTDGVGASTPLIPELPNDERYNQLFLTLVTAEEDVIQASIPNATREQVLNLARQLEDDITNPVRRRNSTPLLEPSQQLYELLVSPLESEFQAREVDNLVFIMDGGLRSLPLAALHDGESFIIENYSVGLMPSLSLTDTRHVGLQSSQVLAMGTAEFPDDPENILSRGSLPAVSLELSTIRENGWSPNILQGEDFRLSNLQDESGYDIIHMATHATFRPGEPENSYIQFQDEPLRLSNFRTLDWSDEQIELMVLSACRTALGDLDAELGFAGAAVQSQVKTVMASLWSVSDIGASGLVAEFYSQLRQAPIKAEALRQAQLAMLQGDVQIEDGKLRWFGGEIDLLDGMDGPSRERMETLLEGETEVDLSHPYYWSAFTLVGSPW